MDEAAEHVHERLMDNIILNCAEANCLYLWYLLIILVFSVVFLYLNHYT